MSGPGSRWFTVLIVSGIFVGSVTLTGCSSREVDERFVRKTYVGASGETLFHRLFVPEMMERDSRYPLVVFLHGGGGAGTDNVGQVSGSNWRGAHVWIQSESQAKQRAFVVAPQIPVLKRWDYAGSDELSTWGELAVELIAELEKTYPIDRDRVYLTGQSLGGWGVWDLIAKRPDMFAAAVPVCGGGDPETAATMRGVSVWAFHGARDPEVSVERSREMVRALRAAGVNVEYTEYRFAGHAIWDRAYAEGDLIDWVFSQRKTR